MLTNPSSLNDLKNTLHRLRFCMQSQWEDVVARCSTCVVQNIANEYDKDDDGNCFSLSLNRWNHPGAAPTVDHLMELIAPPQAGHRSESTSFMPQNATS